MSLETALAAVLLAVQPQVLFEFQDERIAESSALVDGGDVVFTINDSGDSARVFVVDKASGDTVGITTYSGQDPVDVEALSAGPGDTLWVGDIGDNQGVRDHVTVYRIPTPTRIDRAVEPTAYELVYSDGARDAETLLVHPRTGRLYVVSKGLLGGTVYAAPKRLRADRTNVLEPVAAASGLVTDGVFFPEGRHALVRTYSQALVLRAGDFGPIAAFDLPDQEQGEGIGLGGETVLVSTEGEHSAVRTIRLPKDVREKLRPEPAKTPAPSPVEPSPEAQQDGPWGGNVVPLALGAAWVVLLVLGVRAVRRRSRRTQ